MDLTASMDIRMFASKALVKAYSTVPISRSSVMPVSAFTSMFMAWADDDKLSVKDLRLKALTLLALALMLRPSDVAPHGQVLNPSTNKPESLLFTTDNVTFIDNGSAHIRFLGIKNDTARKGFEITLPPAQPPKIDPVLVLKHYIERTQDFRPQIQGPVFLTLKSPYRPIKADTVAQILNDAIKRAGLGGQH